MTTTDNTTTENLKHGAKFSYSAPNGGFNDKKLTYELYVSFTTPDMDGVIEAAENAFVLAQATVYEQAGVPFEVTTEGNAKKVVPTFPTVAPLPKSGGAAPAQASKSFPQGGGGSQFGSAPKPFSGNTGGQQGGFNRTPPNPTKQQIGFVNGSNIFVQQSAKSGKWYFNSPEIKKPDPRKPGATTSVLAFVDDPNGVTAEQAYGLLMEQANA